MCKFGE
ncbi:hypothetical protein CGLO_13386 [Colletotrichum gloeosporioides Cg-14]|nr:hypothetical protein CGLO_13386 [Colletotrichum gloeosporioides Cg-14]